MTLRTTLLVLLSVIIGFAIAAGAIYVLALTPGGQGLMRDFLVIQTAKREAALPTATASSTPVYKTGILPIPESYATTDYFTAINNVLSDIALVNNANMALAPLLTKLDAKTISCSYDGFYDLMGQARALSNQNQALAAQFIIHMTALAAANTETKDAITKSDTQTLITAGQALGSALQTYATSVQNILYGNTPTTAQIAEVQSQVNTAQGDAQTFADALKPLLQRIIAGDQAVIDAASSTPAKK
jgi:hypothetical protein